MRCVAFGLLMKTWISIGTYGTSVTHFGTFSEYLYWEGGREGGGNGRGFHWFLLGKDFIIYDSEGIEVLIIANLRLIVKLLEILFQFGRGTGKFANIHSFDDGISWYYLWFGVHKSTFHTIFQTSNTIIKHFGIPLHSFKFSA